MVSFPVKYQSFTRFTQRMDAWNTIIVSFTPAFPAYFAGGVALPPIIIVQWKMGVSPIWVSFQGNFPLNHDYQEPKWPLFWLEKTLFWRVVSPQNRGQEWFQVWFRKGNPPRFLNHTWNHLGMPLGTVNLPDFFCRLASPLEAAKLLPPGSVDAVDLNCGCPQVTSKGKGRWFYHHVFLGGWFKTRLVECYHFFSFCFVCFLFFFFRKLAGACRDDSRYLIANFTVRNDEERMAELVWRWVLSLFWRLW